MHKLEAAEVTRKRLIDTDILRQQLVIAGKRAPKGVRIGARRFRTAERILEEGKQLTFSNKELSFQGPSLRDQLIKIRDGALGCLDNPVVSRNPREHAKYRLERDWAELKLGGARPKVILRSIASLAERLSLRDGDWLLEIVGTEWTDNSIRSIPRHEAMIKDLETSLVHPAVSRFRV